MTGLRQGRCSRSRWRPIRWTYSPPGWAQCAVCMGIAHHRTKLAPGARGTLDAMSAAAEQDQENGIIDYEAVREALILICHDPDREDEYERIRSHLAEAGRESLIIDALLFCFMTVFHDHPEALSSIRAMVSAYADEDSKAQHEST